MIDVPTDVPPGNAASSEQKILVDEASSARELPNSRLDTTADCAAQNNSD
jgi:hypothetical protein